MHIINLAIFNPIKRLNMIGMTTMITLPITSPASTTTSTKKGPPWPLSKTPWELFQSPPLENKIEESKEVTLVCQCFWLFGRLVITLCHLLYAWIFCNFMYIYWFYSVSSISVSGNEGVLHTLHFLVSIISCPYSIVLTLFQICIFELQSVILLLNGIEGLHFYFL